MHPNHNLVAYPMMVGYQNPGKLVHHSEDTSGAVVYLKIITIVTMLKGFANRCQRV